MRSIFQFVVSWAKNFDKARPHILELLSDILVVAHLTFSESCRRISTRGAGPDKAARFNRVASNLHERIMPTIYFPVFHLQYLPVSVKLCAATSSRADM